MNGDVLNVDYTGWLYDPNAQDNKGTQFDSGNFTFTLGIGQVIPGWDRGLLGMRVGGRRVIVIPPELGYGEDGSPPRIPGNATLLFEVELLSIS
ncbi:MAG: FKBP-type peptidyl-prolyl cis-trans isomerase [Acidobacteria bacterium]|nr:FKBP-type peptidyl-prolyl cis-trans isomerase [Acidobacteriota bacterium]